MSRWNDQFNAHPFQSTWTQLKDSLEQVVVDDTTVVTAVTEVARLRKIIEYLDGLIETVDPEMVPLTTWDTFNQQAAPCLQQINANISNKNIAHIAQANAHADNLLTYLRPYMVLPKDAATSIKRAATMYENTVNDYVDSFQKKANDLIDEIKSQHEIADELSGEIQNKKTLVDNLDIILFGEDTTSGIHGRISELMEDIEDKYQKVVKLYEEVLVGDTDTLSTKKSITQAKETILEHQEQIETLITSVNTEVKDLEQFHTEIFGLLDEDELRKGGLSSELEDLKLRLLEFEKKQQARYKALNNEIETLLPGATSAGLASAYRALRKSFRTPLKTYTNIFYVALATLFLSTFVFIIDGIGFFYINFVDVSTLDKFTNNLLYKVSIFLPVVWLALFASKRRSEAQRLQQEYAHKEALAKSYQSFKKQLDELGADDTVILKQLIESAIDAVSYNASVTLDGKHGDKAPTQSVIENIVEAVLKRSQP